MNARYSIFALLQLTVRASVLVSVVMVTLSSLMSVPPFIGAELKQYISFEKISIEDTLVCIDDRSGAYR